MVLGCHHIEPHHPYHSGRKDRLNRLTWSSGSIGCAGRWAAMVVHGRDCSWHLSVSLPTNVETRGFLFFQPVRYRRNHATANSKMWLCQVGACGARILRVERCADRCCCGGAWGDAPTLACSKPVLTCGTEVFRQRYLATLRRRALWRAVWPTAGWHVQQGTVCGHFNGLQHCAVQLCQVPNPCWKARIEFITSIA